MVGGIQSVKEICVKVPSHWGLSCDTMLISLAEDGNLPLTTLEYYFPGARLLTYKDASDTSLHSVGFDSKKKVFLISPIAGTDKIFEVSCERKVIMKSSTTWDFKNFALGVFVVIVFILVVYILTKGEKDNSSMIAAVSAWAGLASICITIVGVFIGMFVVAKDNFTELKQDNEQFKNDNAKLKEDNENIKNKLEEIEKKV